MPSFAPVSRERKREGGGGAGGYRVKGTQRTPKEEVLRLFSSTSALARFFFSNLPFRFSLFFFRLRLTRLLHEL